MRLLALLATGRMNHAAALGGGVERRLSALERVDLLAELRHLGVHFLDDFGDFGGGLAVAQALDLAQVVGGLAVIVGGLGLVKDLGKNMLVLLQLLLEFLQLLHGSRSAS